MPAGPGDNCAMAHTRLPQPLSLRLGIAGVVHGWPVTRNSGLPADLDARVRSEMRDGEQLLWVGQPRPGRFARQAIPLVLFGIPFTAFAVFWMVVTSSALLFGGFANNVGPGGFGWFFAACFPLFGLPFMLIGLGMLEFAILAPAASQADVCTPLPIIRARSFGRLSGSGP